MVVIDSHKKELENYKRKYGEGQYNFLKAVCKGEIDLSDILEIEMDNSIIGKARRIIYKITSKYISLVEKIRRKIKCLI